MIKIRPINPNTLKARTVQERKTPLNFEYVLLFFSLEKETLWTATMAASKAWPIGHPDHERHSNNLYQFAYRKGIHESHDNERVGKEPVMWDSDSWLHALNPSDFNKGVEFFEKLWAIEQSMQRQGRNCSYAYCNTQGLLVIENYSPPQKPAITNPEPEQKKNKQNWFSLPILFSLILVATAIGFFSLQSNTSEENRAQTDEPQSKTVPIDDPPSGEIIERLVYFPDMNPAD